MHQQGLPGLHFRGSLEKPDSKSRHHGSGVGVKVTGYVPDAAGRFLEQVFRQEIA